MRALALLLATSTIVGCAHARRGGDPPLLVPWNRVGDITLGGSRTAVQREYGKPGHGFHFVQRYSALTGAPAVEGYYALHGGSVDVTFYGNRVGRIAFNVPYYRTSRGFGVGSRIPLGPCHVVPGDTCEHRWHGFVYTPKYHDSPCACWIKVGSGQEYATAREFGKPWFFIYTRRGRVDGFYFALDFVD